MNNIKSTKTSRDSPKTPGGISKSLLTPIRRVGLSRNWKKSGTSPFISPLSNSNSTEVKPESESRKRKAPEDEERLTDSDLIINECNSPITSNVKNVDPNRTPIRNTLSRKKSKTLLLSKECLEEPDNIPPSKPEVECMKTIEEDEVVVENHSPKVSIPKRAGSKSISKRKSPLKLETNNEINKTVIVCDENKVSEDTNEKIVIEDSQCIVSKEKENCNLNKCEKVGGKCPNLTKDCVIVIQKKIFKSLLNKNTNDSLNSKPNQTNTVSQAVFDSDSDDVPLNILNKKENEKEAIGNIKENSDEDDNFQPKKVAKFQDKSTSISGLKLKKGKNKLQSLKPEKELKIKSTPSSQSSISIDEDDDDFEFQKKKTILIKKTYEKGKPIRAKSTGSITQRDIEELTKRIEKKKKMLLAKAMTNETVELRGLIKKWQTGCQSALTELLDLMKKQMPDKQNMEYSEILQMLKIPSKLVGYDSENECFNTPNDESIIMSGLNI